MKKLKIILLSSMAIMTLGIGTVSANTKIDAAKYVDNVQDLQKILTDKNKGFILEEVKVENNKDNTKQPIYKIDGFNKNKTEEVEMKVNADKTSDIIKNKTESMDSGDKQEAIGINVNDVKKNPKDAITLAKKYSNENINPSKWLLEMDKVNGKEQPVYKVKFKISKHSDKIVTLSAINGDEISIEYDN